MFYVFNDEQNVVHFLFIFVHLSIMEIVLLAIALTTAGLLLRHNARIQAARDALAARQTYEHVACPILVTSDFPDDTTVLQRAQAWREKLRAAGNKYSEVLPVVPYPFALGASEQTGTLRTWLTYRRNCILKELEVIREWEAKMQRENEAMFNGHILNQN